MYAATGEEAALLAAFVQHILLLQQLLPLLRFDGYYVLSDLTGVPDILSRIKPILRSVVKPRDLDPRVEELKPWVRVVVTAYLVALVPALALLVLWLVIGIPRIAATTYDSVGLQLDRLQDASGPDEYALGGFRILALVMPFAAMSLGLGRTGKRAGLGLIGWARGSTVRAAFATTGVAAVLAGATYVLLPERRLRADPPVRSALRRTPRFRLTTGGLTNTSTFSPRGAPDSSMTTTSSSMWWRASSAGLAIVADVQMNTGCDP